MKRLEFDYTDRFGDKVTLVPELALYSADDILTNKERNNIAIRLWYKEGEEIEPYGVLTTNLGEFISVITEFEKNEETGNTLGEFLENISLVSDILEH